MTTKLPDGPKIPGWLQLIEWIRDPLGFMEDCASRYGDVFTVRWQGFKPYVFISSPQAIQEIFTADAKSFDTGRSNGVFRPFVGDNSLVLLDGDRHKRDRKLLMPPFHGDKVRSYAQIICQVTEQVASRWQVDLPFIARNAMQEITLEVILHAVFGLSEGERYQKIKPLLTATVDTTNSPISSSFLFFNFLQQDWGSWSPWSQMIRRKQEVYDLLQAEIEERRTHPELMGNDILSLMLSATDENGQTMSDEDLKDELMTLLVAGHETTATSLAWAFYWVNKLPAVKEKLLQEIDSLDNNPDPMNMVQLPYLNAVCQETLRIYPVLPIAFPRIAKSEIEIMGYQFEPETLLAPCIYLTHHREDIYPEPKQFKPERFLDRQYSPHEFMAFGGGNRRCLGYALAMLEMKLVIGIILSGYHLKLANKEPIKPQRRGPAIAPHNGVPLVMTGKRDFQKPTAELIAKATK